MSFSVNEFLYQVNKANPQADSAFVLNIPYAEVLEKVRSTVSEHYATELARVVTDEAAREALRSIIQHIVTSQRLVDTESSGIGDMVDRLYEDMAGFSFLSAYLSDPVVQEININGALGVWVIDNNGKGRSDQRFSCSNDCLNMVRKMIALGGVIVDGSKPLADSFISRGVRISGAISPCVDEDVQAVASIRKQQAERVTKELLVQTGTYSIEELYLLETLLTHGVSIGVCGGVGSGKTSDMSLLLKSIPDDKRIITIEDTRELDLLRYDSSGLMINDVVHFLTKEGAKPITMQMLTKFCLRFSPDYIVPAEMRGVEALDVANAGITGHVIASTLHADSAEAAYDRILAMCMPATHLSEERMLRIIVAAFPIMAYKEKLADGSRRMMEIYEATGIKMGPDGRTVVVEGHYLYQYQVEGYERDETGKPIKVIGKHMQVGGISERLAAILRKKAVEQKTIDSFMLLPAAEEATPEEAAAQEAEAVSSAPKPKAAPAKKPASKPKGGGAK